jgi:ubiquinone/menaquinone biosynthesis C-methylase UbiE
VSPQEQWQLAGNAPEVYERYLVPAIFGPWAPVLNDLVRPQPDEHVLDVACGTGVVARVAAERVGATGRVVGVDLNPGMLAVARALPPPPGASIVWHEGSADALPLPEASFDVVFCQLGLQYFPDRPKALREMCRVLRPSGRMALLVWRSIQHSPGFALLAEALAQHVSAEAAAIMRAPFAFEEAETLRSLTEGAGFHAVEAQATRGTVRFPSPADFVRWQAAGSPLAGPVAQASERARDALLDQMLIVLRPYVGAEGLVFPIAAHLVQAQK